MKCPIEPMTHKHYYLIVLMICCIGGQGDALDIMQDYRWFPFGFGLPIWASQISMDSQRLLAIHFWDDGDMLGTLCPGSPHSSPTLLAGVPGLVRCHGSIHSTIWALVEDLQASLIHMETHGVIYVPSYPLGAPQSTTRRTRSHPLVHHIPRNLFLNMALEDIIEPLEGATTCTYYYLVPCEAYFYTYELVWWACHQ